MLYERLPDLKCEMKQRRMSLKEVILRMIIGIGCVSNV
jgi:hypothetical protein